MQKLLTFALFFGLAATVTSCSKSVNKAPQTSPLNTPAEKTARVNTVYMDTMDLLTGQTWVYYEYFTDFNSPATSLAWKTNRTSNTLNFSLNKVNFYPNGTYTEVTENGVTYNGTWSFLNSQTQVKVVNPAGTFISTIERLTQYRYEWLMSNGRYGVMVSQIPPPSTVPITNLELLTELPWFYDEYFTNFNQAAPSVVWKFNKANSTFNLSKNSVKYNTDGTYFEFDQFGTEYKGTWKFLNNETQLQVTNSTGTYTSNIKVLTTRGFEWLDVNGSNYGAMVHYDMIHPYTL